MEKTLAQVFLMVSDIDRSVEFYRDALGLPVRSRGETRATFETGASELMIEEDFDAETLAAFGLRPPGTDRGDGVIVVIEVTDVDGIYEQAAAVDAAVRLPPTDVDWGRRIMLVQDPDGYVLEISRPLEN